MEEQRRKLTDDQLAREMQKGSLGGFGGRIVGFLGWLVAAAGVIAGVSIPVIIVGALIIGLGGWLRQKTKGTANQLVIDTITPDVVNAALENVQMEPYPRLLNAEDTNIPLPKHDCCSGRGYIRGTYQGLTTELCTVQLTEMHEFQREETGQWEKNEVTVYTGQWMLCELGREFPTWLTIWPRDKLFHSSTIQTGSEAFDKRFGLSSDDAQAALRILTPSRVDRILTLADSAYGKFSLNLNADGRLYLAVHNGRGFFDVGRGRERPEILRQRFSGELKWFTDMIDAFLPSDAD